MGWGYIARATANHDLLPPFPSLPSSRLLFTWTVTPFSAAPLVGSPGATNITITLDNYHHEPPRAKRLDHPPIGKGFLSPVVLSAHTPATGFTLEATAYSVLSKQHQAATEHEARPDQAVLSVKSRTQPSHLTAVSPPESRLRSPTAETDSPPPPRRQPRDPAQPEPCLKQAANKHNRPPTLTHILADRLSSH